MRRRTIRQETRMRSAPRREGTKWLALALAMILVLAACSDDTAADTTVAPDATQPDTTEPETPDTTEPDDEAPDPSDDESVVNLHLYQEPRSWNPTNPSHGPDTMVMGMIYQRLFVPTPDDTYEPRLAESWEVSDDARTFTFHLFEGLSWSDGTPLTSQDVKFSFELLANPDATAAATQWDGVLGWEDFAEGRSDELAGLRTPDEQTFVLELAEPNVGYMAHLALMMTFVLPEHILGDVPHEDISDHPYFLEPTVAYGQYNLVRYEEDQFIELAANPDYHLGAPQIDRIFLYHLPSDVGAAQLGTGEIDVALISATDVEIVSGFDDVTVRPAQGTGYLRMGLATIHEENSGGEQPQARFQDRRVRQAMMYAIDRQAIVDTVFGGFAEVVNTGFHTSWAVPDDLNDYAYNPDLARQLLDEAGWDSSEPVIVAWGGGNRDRDATMEIVQQQWNDVGIQTELIPTSPGQEVDHRDAGFFGGGFFTVEPNSFVQHSCGSGRNNAGFCNPDLDELWREADSTTDPDQRAELFQEVARILNEEVPYIYMVNEHQIWATSNRIEGFEPNGFIGDQFDTAFQWRIQD